MYLHLKYEHSFIEHSIFLWLTDTAACCCWAQVVDLLNYFLYYLCILDLGHCLTFFAHTHSLILTQPIA